MSADSEDPGPRRGRFTAEEARKQAEAARQKAEIIFSRAYGLFRDPKAEWEQIRAEETNVPSILLGYVAPLAAIIPICSLLGSGVFGERMGDTVVRTDLGRMLVGAIVTFLAVMALVYFLGLLINVVAENFDGQKDELAAQKVAAYSMTPFLMSGLFWLWPPLWWMTLVGVAMTAFLFYRGLPPLMKAPEDRAQGYAVTVVIAGLIAFIVLLALSSCVTGVGRLPPSETPPP